MTITISDGASHFDWFTSLQSLGIILGFFFSGYAIWKDVGVGKLQNYILLVQNHRAVWTMLLDDSRLSRVISQTIPNDEMEITYEESYFLRFLFLHITCSFEMSKRGKIIDIQKDRNDIRDLLSLPLVGLFWEKNGHFYNEDFRNYIDLCVVTEDRIIVENGLKWWERTR